MAHRRLVIVLLSAALLSACVVAPYPRRGAYYEPVPQAGYGQPGYGQPGMGIDVAPPAPYVEVVPIIPFLGAVWLSGYWGWNGGRHHWQPGRWDHARPGYRWQPHAWVNQGGRWHQRGGGWARH